MVFIKRPSTAAVVSAAARKAAAKSKHQVRLPAGKVKLFQKKKGKFPPLPRPTVHVVYNNLRPSIFPELSGTAVAQTHNAFEEDAGVGMDFNNGAVALATKSNLELIRALGVFNICGFPWIVKNARTMYNMSIKVFGQSIPDAAVGVSFFSHFCGGTSAEELRPVMKRLGSHGVGAILDYAAEADVVDENLSEMGPNKANDIDQIIKMSEAHCESNTKVIFHAIDAAAQAEKDGGMQGFAAVKLTGMGRPELLERISTILTWLRATFSQMDTSGDGMISQEKFKEGLKNLKVTLTDEEKEALFETIDVDHNGQVDLHEWLDGLSPISPVFAPLFESKLQILSSLGLSALSETESMQLANMLSRLERVAAYADSKGVKMLVDAEQSYMQPAIDHLTLLLMERYNTNHAVIFNTYQCYLVDSYRRVVADMERAERNGFVFAAKMVRGAYMIQERRLAELRGYPDPIHANIKATHENYDSIIEMILRYKAAPDLVVEGSAMKRRATSVMLASHNESSVTKAVQLMAKLGIPRQESGVYFGQLQGMCDHVSYLLGEKQYSVYKYLPYGPVKEVMPYLLRRAEENGDLMGGVGKERKMIEKELKRRAFEALGLAAKEKKEYAHAH